MTDEIHGTPEYWEGEAKRYAQNAEYWRGEADRLLGEAKTALSQIKLMLNVIHTQEFDTKRVQVSHKLVMQHYKSEPCAICRAKETIDE